ncbi:MAG TPA: class I SAM-dependent methyltransferase [Gaiellaceae bacterium]|nr:class I SAM-dependent methyltransferase [Gaiellaceae bacterium]
MAVAPDGSPVELYSRLSPRGEAELVHAVIPPGAEILELGCGVGRVTHELVRLGHPVVAVDESPEMLERVRGAVTVCSRIEGLNLGRRFPCVLLMSNLVNADDERDAFLAACARHLTPDGVVLIERHEPNWRPEEDAPKPLGDVLVSLTNIRIEPPYVSGVVLYRLEHRVWRHAFRARLLDDEELRSVLARTGLELVRSLDEPGRWMTARLYSSA